MIDTTYEETAPHPVSYAPDPTAPPASTELPYYMHEVYDWAYVNPAWARWLDHNIVVKTLLFGNDQRLMRKYLNRIKPGMRVWQVAHVYGDLTTQAAKLAGNKGCFHLTDVTPIQIEHARAKLQNMPWAHIFQHDAATFADSMQSPYDLTCSFMLLHEVPDEWKQKIVDNMLAQTTEHGEALFVDYNSPKIWQPVRYILKLVNRFLEPFAHALWQKEIRDFCSHPDRYVWHKETIFAGVYQIVSVKRKSAN